MSAKPLGPLLSEISKTQAAIEDAREARQILREQRWAVTREIGRRIDEANKRIALLKFFLFEFKKEFKAAKEAQT